MQQSVPLVLDGSTGEGGGQILRTALFLSLLTRRPFRMQRIRQGRREPGLKPQHTGILDLLRDMTQSQADGVRVGSPEVSFTPGRLRSGAWRYDIGTAGSIPLFLQTVLPVMMAAPGNTELTLIGGTDVTFGPTIEWVRRCYVPWVEPVTDSIDVAVDRRGFYPRGGGQVRVRVRGATRHAEPAEFAQRVALRLGTPRLRWTAPVAYEALSVATDALAPRQVAERQLQELKAQLGQPTLRGEALYASSLSPGTSLTLVAVDAVGNRIGADGLGAQGVTAEEVARRVATKFKGDVETGATVDEHLADHVVPWIALGAAAVRVPRITGHLQTNVWTCRQFLGETVRVDGLVVGPKK